jgi:hypothetical protein
VLKSILSVTTFAEKLISVFSLQLREKLFAAIENQGFGLEKQAELMGRAATELALQLLGGQHRYHQCFGFRSGTTGFP